MLSKPDRISVSIYTIHHVNRLSCSHFKNGQSLNYKFYVLRSGRGNVRMTENKRLATAAAAIKQRMVNRRSPLEFFPVLPTKKGSAVFALIVASCCLEVVHGYLF